MRFGEIPAGEAEGAILAHTIRLASALLKKGTRLSAGDIRSLREAGISHVPAARLDPDDMPEDEAAKVLAGALCGPQTTADEPIAGRVNLRAATSGLCLIDPAVIDAINRVHESLTVASVRPFTKVTPRTLVATIKVIPFAAPVTAVKDAETRARAAPLRVAPFTAKRTALIVTGRENQKSIAATRARLFSLGMDLCKIIQATHNRQAVEAAIEAAMDTAPDLLLLLGETATTDRRDIIPSAVEASGGTIEHFGMPVDPGNLLVLARINSCPAVILPGCARSPSLNGFDWVLERLAADIPVSAGDLMGMGVGGLLKEIPSRPQPREGRPPTTALKIEALLLAAGESRRMGRANKLLEEIGDTAIVRRAARNLLDADLSVTVVTGNEAERVTRALEGLPVRHVHADDWANGMGRSIRAGIAALGGDADGVLIALGDMPNITPADISALVAAFGPDKDAAVCVPVHDGRRGNPVLFARNFFENLAQLEGDIGGRAILAAHAAVTVEVPCGPGVLLDVDTPEALEKARRS